MDFSHFMEWLGLGVRWLHVVAGVVWIGTSFYFVWLNNHVRPPAEDRDGVDGEVWAIHGGGFYRVQRFHVAPPVLPSTLHWFKWEAYTTWLSGFSLLILIYYIDARIYLIDPGRADFTVAEASFIGTAVLVVGWLVYHGLCRSPLFRSPGAFNIVGFGLLVLTAIGLSAIFSGRGAYIHFGALIGTLMAGNVFFVIIPAQREMVNAMEEGREPDAAKGRHAAQRSLHNNYLTLPVLFIMVSNHFPFTYGHRWNWLILIGLFVVGADIRHWFNLRGQGRRNHWLLPAAAAGLIALAFVTAPSAAPPTVPFDEVGFDEGIGIVEARCTSCHSANPTQPGFSSAPGGVVLDDPDVIVSMAPLIRTQAVERRTMPPGNITGMTDEERAKLRAWLDTHTGG